LFVSTTGFTWNGTKPASQQLELIDMGVKQSTPKQLNIGSLYAIEMK